MSLYRVAVEQTERVEWVVEAVDPIDAENRYLSDGEEVNAEVLERSEPVVGLNIMNLPRADDSTVLLTAQTSAVLRELKDWADAKYHHHKLTGDGLVVEARTVRDGGDAAAADKRQEESEEAYARASCFDAMAREIKRIRGRLERG